MGFCILCLVHHKLLSHAPNGALNPPGRNSDEEHLLEKTRPWKKSVSAPKWLTQNEA